MKNFREALFKLKSNKFIGNKELFEQPLLGYKDFAITGIIYCDKQGTQNYFIDSTFNKKTLSFLNKLNYKNLTPLSNTRESFDMWQKEIENQFIKFDLEKYGFTKKKVTFDDIYEDIIETSNKVTYRSLYDLKRKKYIISSIEDLKVFTKGYKKDKKVDICLKYNRISGFPTIENHSLEWPTEEAELEGQIIPVDTMNPLQAKSSLVSNCEFIFKLNETKNERVIMSLFKFGNNDSFLKYLEESSGKLGLRNINIDFINEIRDLIKNNPLKSNEKETLYSNGRMYVLQVSKLYEIIVSNMTLFGNYFIFSKFNTLEEFENFLSVIYKTN